ncbi:helix-turn-helix domain-containing protein [Streptomyces sp. WMMC940]|uniref:helix-turn-helix domain-containing protein n=1 Tax=Streptomyces sp. WMMC940 TaxID=3015153 RepID=UPI0022B6D64C|nr:helix-turn-helix transcriptional regulator [Streptomyces sp. WMMC940]MCZ7459567.1 helix-turn-helix transcriptional regulator [Streptomyces sp. WMMC940]
MPTSRQLKELGKFLTVRRAEIAPAQVGLPVAGVRRTPGLRREEVALLAGVGVSWYTWIEQGRAENVSAEILSAISRVLNLDDTQRQYVRRLAGLGSDHTAASTLPDAESLQPYVDNWLPNPAYIADRVWNVTVANRTAREVLGMDGGTGNIIRDFFTHQDTRRRYPAWEQDAPTVVARFRSHAASYPGDPLLATEIDRLRGESREFSDLWNAQDVQEDSCGIDLFEHPDTGEISLKRTTLDFTVRLGLRLTVFFPVPGTGAQQSIERLASHLPDRTRLDHVA